MGYSRDVLKGISWTWLLRMCTRIISFLKIAILARFLSPAQFGLYGIASLVLLLLEVLTETGINVFIIQENEDVDSIVSTAWIISILRGILISLIIILLVPFITFFFRSPDSTNLIILIALVPFIKGFINPSIVKFQKELMFDKEFYFRGSLFTLESVSGVLFVLLLRDPVGIIYGLMIGAIAEVILSFLLLKPIPSLSFNRVKGRKIISRGKWLTLSGIFNYLYHNGDDAVAGRILGTASLGLYQMAYKISMFPINEIGGVVSKVALPVYVRISGDRLRLKRAFIKTSVAVFLLTTPIAVIFFLFAKEIVLLVLGPAWVSAVPVFKVLSVFGVVRTSIDPIHLVFLSLKKQEFSVLVNIISFTVMILTIIPLITRYGLVGAGIAVILGSLIASPIGFFLAYKLLHENKK